MAWLYLPSTICPSAPEEPDSTLQSDWRFQLLERSALWRSTPLPARGWSRICKRVPWMTHLSGQILKPSTADRGVASWISSLAATRANRSPWLADDAEQTILATYGRTWRELFRRYDRPVASSRMFQDTLALDLPKSDHLWKAWVTRLRQEYTARRKQARAKAEHGFSSSRLWRTPHASDGEGGVMEMRPGTTGHYKLRDHVVNWPSPATRDYKGANGSDHLTNGRGRKHLDQLPNFVAHKWPTPRTTDHHGPGEHGTGGKDLRTAASLHTLMKHAHGGKPCAAPRSLNPLFVEWLMGWPIGWTDYASAVTELSPWLARWRSYLFGVVSRSENG